MQVKLYAKKIWLYRQAVDFRRGIDGLLGLLSTDGEPHLREGIYLFYNSHRDKVKCLTWHKNGFMLLYKRLEKGRFDFSEMGKKGMIEMTETELGWLLAGLEWQKMRQWEELNYDKFS